MKEIILKKFDYQFPMQVKYNKYQSKYIFLSISDKTTF